MVTQRRHGVAETIDRVLIFENQIDEPARRKF